LKIFPFKAQNLLRHPAKKEKLAGQLGEHHAGELKLQARSGQQFASQLGVHHSPRPIANMNGKQTKPVYDCLFVIHPSRIKIGISHEIW